MQHHTDYQMELDFISKNQIIYRVDKQKIDELRTGGQYENIVLQLCESGIFTDLIRITADWVSK